MKTGERNAKRIDCLETSTVGDFRRNWKADDQDRAGHNSGKKHLLNKSFVTMSENITKHTLMYDLMKPRESWINNDFIYLFQSGLFSWAYF